jgi:hypothetical protein
VKQPAAAPRCGADPPGAITLTSANFEQQRNGTGHVGMTVSYGRGAPAGIDLPSIRWRPLFPRGTFRSGPGALTLPERYRTTVVQPVEPGVTD